MNGDEKRAYSQGSSEAAPDSSTARQALRRVRCSGRIKIFLTKRGFLTTPAFSDYIDNKRGAR